MHLAGGPGEPNLGPGDQVWVDPKNEAIRRKLRSTALVRVRTTRRKAGGRASSVEKSDETAD